MIAMCPWCDRLHDSDEYDEKRQGPCGWYFVCCGHTRLVWERDGGGELRLKPVLEDCEEE